MSPPTDEASKTAWRAAVHEAGHVLADHLFGFCPIEARILADGSGNSSCRDDWPTPATAKSYAVACMAGLAAEFVLNGNDETSEVGASGDKRKAEQALTLCASVSTDESYAAAQELLSSEKNRSSLTAIANDLFEKRELVAFDLRASLARATGDVAAGDDAAPPGQRMAVIKSLAGMRSSSILRDAPPSALVRVNENQDAEQPAQVVALSHEDLQRLRSLGSEPSDFVMEFVGAGDFQMVIQGILELSDDVIEVRPYGDQGY